jgi:hypothetical protein
VPAVAWLGGYQGARLHHLDAVHPHRGRGGHGVTRRPGAGLGGGVHSALANLGDINWLADRGVALVGAIPPGLPQFAAPDLSMARQRIVPAAGLVLVALAGCSCWGPWPRNHPLQVMPGPLTSARLPGTPQRRETTKDGGPDARGSDPHRR